MICDEDPLRRRPRESTARRKRQERCVWMARKMTEWPSKRGPITKIMPSDGCIGDTVPLAVGKWYDFHEFGWYMGNVGQHLLHVLSNDHSLAHSLLHHLGTLAVFVACMGDQLPSMPKGKISRNPRNCTKGAGEVLRINVRVTSYGLNVLQSIHFCCGILFLFNEKYLFFFQIF